MLYQDATLQEYAEVKPPFLPYGEPDLCNDYILKDPDYIDRFCINFPCHCVLNQVDSDTDLLDDVILTKDVLRPTKKPRSVGSHKSKLEKTTSRKKSRLKKQEIQECEHTPTWRVEECKDTILWTCRTKEWGGKHVTTTYIQYG